MSSILEEPVSEVHVIHRRIDELNAKVDDTRKELNSKVDENRKHCDHGKNNLTGIIQEVSKNLGRTQAMQENMQASLDRAQIKGEAMGAQISTVAERQAVNKVTHESNSYLIKWQMGLIGGLIVAVGGAAVMIAIRQ